MYPVMMSIQIHARGSGFFFYLNGAIWRILSVPKSTKKNQQFSRLILHNSKDYLPYQSSIPIQIRMLARE